MGIQIRFVMAIKVKKYIGLLKELGNLQQFSYVHDVPLRSNIKPSKLPQKLIYVKTFMLHLKHMLETVTTEISQSKAQLTGKESGWKEKDNNVKRINQN